MNIKTCFATIFIAALCLLTSGCFNIEQEIFLEPDGSGDMVFHISMPDVPELMKTKSPVPEPNLQKLLDEFKQKFPVELPPTIKLKEAKEVRRHGAIAFYFVLHFNQLSDFDSMLAKFSKENLSKNSPAQLIASINEPVWRIQLEKAGDLTVMTQRFHFDIIGVMGAAMDGTMGAGKPESAKAPNDSSPSIESQPPVTPKSAPKPASKGTTRRTARGSKSVEPKEENPLDSITDNAVKGLMDKELMNLIYSSLFKLRFVLHAPKKITETNADILLNEKIAVWNATFGAFINEKKPIEMKVTY
jgi:hypothetical protein